MAKCPKCGESIDEPNAPKATMVTAKGAKFDVPTVVITCPKCDTVISVIYSPFAFWQAMEKRLRDLVTDLGKSILS